MFELGYTPHALRRMRQRGISRFEVERSLQMRSLDVPSPDDPRRRKITSTVGSRRVTVVVEPGAYGFEVVVTVWCPDERDIA